MWLLVLSFVLAFAVAGIIVLFILALSQRRREQLSKEQYIQLRELFRQYIDSGAGAPKAEPAEERVVEGSPYYSATQAKALAMAERTNVAPSTPSLLGQKLGRTRGNLKVNEDGTVGRVLNEGDVSTIEARIAANSAAASGFDRMSGQNPADMAALATTGNLEDPDDNRPPTVTTVTAGPPSLQTPVSAVPRARLVPRTFTAGFGKGLEIDTYNDDTLKGIEKEKEEENDDEEPLVL